jgi:hypothetical protein
MTKAQVKEVKAAAQAHVKAMKQLYAANMHVPLTTAKLVEVLTRNADDSGAPNPLYQKADEAMDVLQAAYTQVAAIFDDLPE